MNLSNNPLFANSFLALLSIEDFSAIQPLLKTSNYDRGALLIDDGAEVENIYFPLSGMISLLVVTQDGDSIETATVGREGVVGVGAGLGLHIASVKAVMQMPGSVCEIPAAKFRAAVSKSAVMRDLCIRYNEVMLIQAQTTVACNALHSIEQRFCRWLLQSAKVVGENTVPLTQEFMSQMLGVQRSSVSQVANKIQKLGHIQYVRGQIRILDRRALEIMACECFDTIQKRTARVWPRRS